MKDNLIELLVTTWGTCLSKVLAGLLCIFSCIPVTAYGQRENHPNVVSILADDLGYGDKPIQQGPTARGFDYFYGISASLDMPPYLL